MAVSILGTTIFPITLVVVVAMCLKDKKHSFSIRLSKNGFKVSIKPID